MPDIILTVDLIPISLPQPNNIHRSRPHQFVERGGASLKSPIMTTEWSLDFCLVCDRQTLGGAYCSQSCRLAELDILHEPTAASTQELRAALRKSPSHAVRFLTTNPTSSTTQISSLKSCRPHYPRTLSPSSSQTSLSSLRSYSSHGSPISSQSQTELRDYASCFDHVRDLKRRLTSWFAGRPGKS